MEMGKKRMAVLVGCNYPNTLNELHGCINDVVAMKSTLVARFGFKDEDIELLTDAPDSPDQTKPTATNIRKALNRMICRAEDGDVLCFVFSGHGTQLPLDQSGTHPGFHEAIVPSDYHWITDVEFMGIVNSVPEGVSFTIFSDSCYSGGLIDKEKEQIGPSVVDVATRSAASSLTNMKPRFMPFQAVLEELGISGTNVSVTGTQFAGSETNILFNLPLPLIRSELNSYYNKGIFLSACQAKEFSFEIYDEGKSHGLFTYAVLNTLKEKPGPISNKELVTFAGNFIQSRQPDRNQHPCLYCSDERASSSFLCQLN